MQNNFSNHANSKGNVQIIVAILIASVLSIAGTYLYLSDADVPNDTKKAIDIIKDTSKTEKPSVPAEPKELVDWQRKTGDNCNTSFLIPPKKEPYFTPYNENVYRSGLFWDFPRGGSTYPNVLGTLVSDNYKQDLAMYVMDSDVGSGAVTSAVAVSCSEIASIKDNRQLEIAIKASLGTFNNTDIEDWLGPRKLKVREIKTINKWDQEVLQIDLTEFWGDMSGGQPVTLQKTYYLFVDGKKTYEVSTIGLGENTYDSPNPISQKDQFIAETAVKILDNIRFN